MVRIVFLSSCCISETRCRKLIFGREVDWEDVGVKRHFVTQI